MSTLESIEDLYNYCLRALGAPVINVHVDITQVEDRLSDVIQQFMLHHYDATEEVIIPVALSAATIARGYIALPESITGVLEVYNADGAGSSSVEEFERLNFLLKDTDLYNNITATGELSSYYSSMQHIALMQSILAPKAGFSYNSITNKLVWNARQSVGQVIMIHAFKNLDVDDYPNIFNNEWIKKAAIAHVKLQWGTNLKLMGGIQLAGGIELNGQQIYDEAAEEIQRLNEEFMFNYSLPDEIMIG